jgi:hypothetical protein
MDCARRLGAMVSRRQEQRILQLVTKESGAEKKPKTN